MKYILQEYAKKYGATIKKNDNGGAVALFNQTTAGERLKAFENFFTAISKYIDARSGLFDGKIAVYLSIQEKII